MTNKDTNPKQIPLGKLAEQTEPQPVNLKDRAAYIKGLKADKEVIELEASIEEADARIWTARVNRMMAQARYMQMTHPPKESPEAEQMKQEFEESKSNT